MTQNYPTFRGLLRGAICTRTQAQFANESGISAEHLSRMLNADTIHRPTKATLHKIAAAAKNGVTFQLLMDALDEDDGTTAHPSEVRLAQARDDFAPDFKDMACNTMDALCCAIASRKYPVIVESIAEHVAGLVADAEKAGDGPVLPMAYEIGTGRRNFGVACPHATHYVTVFLSMADPSETAMSEMMVDYTELPCGGDRVQYVIQRVSCAVDDISDQYGTSNAMLDFAVSVSGEEDMEEPEALEATLKLRYYLDFAPVQQFKETYPGRGNTPEERLLDKIFGTRSRWSETIDGFGFPIRSIPDGLAAFLSQHPGPVLAAYDGQDDGEQEKRSKMERAVKEWGILEDSPGIARDLDEMEYQDRDGLGDKGWPAAVAEIMRAETGFPFYWHAPAEDQDEFPCLSKYGCIMVSEADREAAGIQREALLFAVSRYAKALGVKRFGDMLFTGVREVFRKPKTYVVNEDAQDDDGPAYPDEPASFVEFGGAEAGPWPDDNGLYLVELKDGRRVYMVYLKEPNDGVWVKYHKEWSHMVARYCPDKLPLSSQAGDSGDGEAEDDEAE